MPAWRITVVAFLAAGIGSPGIPAAQGLPTNPVQEYPSKPIRLLVGFPAGSSLDTAARVVSGKLFELLRQNVIVDNRPGAAGNIAMEIVVRARPDG